MNIGKKILVIIFLFPLAWVCVEVFELIGYFKNLSDQGVIPYVTAFLFWLGLYYLLLAKNKPRFNTVCELVPVSGFLGTVLGLITQIDILVAGGESKEGLVTALLTTGQGLILVILLQLLKMLFGGKKQRGFVGSFFNHTRCASNQEYSSVIVKKNISPWTHAPSRW